MKHILFLLLTSFSISAQVKGVVKDSLTNLPISYVNIWVENENIGTTSELDGSFTLNITDKNKNLIISVLGYQRKVIKAHAITTVFLSEDTFEFQEFIVNDKKESKQIEIGFTDNALMQTFDNGPKIEAKYFPYKESYKRTKYIKKVTLQSDSKIDSATVKIHFYSVNEDGSPGKELLTKDLIVTVGKGPLKQRYTVSKFDIVFPKTGLFVAYEKILIAKNKVETFKVVYYPLVLYNRVERDFLYTFTGGKWIKKEGTIEEKLTVYEPAINLILSN
jgi:hypothetical protein